MTSPSGRWNTASPFSSVVVEGIVVGVGVGVFVGVAVFVGVEVEVAVFVDVGVAVEVGVAVQVGVGTAVADQFFATRGKNTFGQSSGVGVSKAP
jgi:hypothetical protein